MGQVVSGKRVNPPAKMLTFLPPGVLLGISGGGVPLDCPNPDPVLKKCHFLHPFSDTAFKDSMRKRFLKINFESTYLSFFLTLLELKR